MYTIVEGLGNPFANRYAWALGRGRSLDLGATREAAVLLTGTYDFSHFGVVADTDPRPPVKTVSVLIVQRLPPTATCGAIAPVNDPVVTAACVSDCFLYHILCFSVTTF